MKTSHIIKLSASALLTAMLAACASQVTQEAPAPTASPASPASQPQSATLPQGSVAGNALGGSDSIDKRSIYYDFDSYALRPEFEPVVETNADYLKRHPGANVRIEGNCDERGSTEYNIALGQRRADGVKKMLVLAGASERQIDTVSYGEEKPKAHGHDEQSWAQNRRSDFDYTRTQ